MILGPYLNPPYRTPTRHSSPKRKLSDDSPEARHAQSLRVDTSQISDGTALVPDSPRSKVAERLKDLAIRQAQPAGPRHLNERPSSSPSPRKKLERNPQMRDLRGVIQSQQLAGDVHTPQRSRPPEVPESVSDNTTYLPEVGETPDAHAQLPPTPLPRGDGVSDLREAFDIVMSEPEPHQVIPRHKRMLSPPPPSPFEQVPQEPTSNSDPFSYNSPNSSSGEDPAAAFTLSSLTWQDSEITGHEITSPDDDGEGINGIGFRPTPAIAYARSQKRRQQVEGWKAREAREARQRRMDRRRGPSRSRRVSANHDRSSDDMADTGSGRRMVRFAA